MITTTQKHDITTNNNKRVGASKYTIYTVNHKKRATLFNIEYNSGFSWWISILFVPVETVETGKYTLQTG